MECQRIMREHLGEHACISDNRVIGYLAPTRGKSAELNFFFFLEDRLTLSRFHSHRGYLAKGSLHVHTPRLRRVHIRLDVTFAGTTICKSYFDAPVRFGYT